MADEPDPNNIDSLQQSLNDSATRVSTLWISYLIFGLYLLIAAGTATHRQLLLAEPLKLPVLGSDVPLVLFFVISPALLVLLHFYLFIQILLLGRTAQAYNSAVDLALHLHCDNNRIRERLANTLFAQFFAGAPRERSGWIGGIIRSIAWITLVGGPIFLIFTFQVTFLPYHNSTVTWIHRFLISAEIFIAIILGPIALDPNKDFNAATIRKRLRRIAKSPRRLLAGWGCYPLRIESYYIGQLSYLVLVAISWFVIVFPGEKHINFLTGQSLDTVACATDSLLNKWDRLTVVNDSVVDSDKVAKWDIDAPKDQARYQGARSKDLTARDFNCSTFEATDFRRVNLSGARLLNSKLQHARLEGADLTGALLEDADLSFSLMNGADLSNAHLRKANFSNAKLDGVVFSLADLRMADFSLSSLVGADFSSGKNMQGINFINADMRIAHLNGVNLDGASLQRANLDGVILSGASLIVAEFEDTQLQAASMIPQPFPPKPGVPKYSYDRADFSLAHLNRTWLSLSDMGAAKFADAVVSETSLWGTRNIDCSNAFVSKPYTSHRIKLADDPNPFDMNQSDSGVEATKDAISEFEYDLGSHAERSVKILFKTAGAEPLNQTCSDNSETRQYDPAAYAKLIAHRVCDVPPTSNQREMAVGVVRNALDPDGQPKELAYIGGLAEGLLRCVPEESFDSRDVRKLKEELNLWKQKSASH